MSNQIKFTSRELEIIAYVCNEYSSQEIGKLLKIQTGTVDTHRKKILRKIGVTSTVGLVKYVIKNKMIEL